MEEQNKTEKQLITLREAAKTLGCTPQYLNILSRSGELKAEKLGRNWYTTNEWLETFAEAKETKKPARNVTHSVAGGEEHKLQAQTAVGVKNISVGSKTEAVFWAVFSFVLISALGGGIYLGIINSGAVSPKFNLPKIATDKILEQLAIQKTASISEITNIFSKFLITGMLLLLGLILAAVSFFWLVYFSRNILTVAKILISDFRMDWNEKIKEKEKKREGWETKKFQIITTEKYSVENFFSKEKEDSGFFSKFSKAVLVGTLALGVLFISNDFADFGWNVPQKMFSIFSPDKSNQFGKVLGIENNNNYAESTTTTNNNNQETLTYSRDFKVINNQVFLNLEENKIDSNQIAFHAIEARNIDSNSINSRTIKNLSIRSEDLSRYLTIQHLIVDDELEVSKYLSVGNNEPDNFSLTNGDGFFSGNLEVSKTIYVSAMEVGATTITGNLNMQNNIIQNIGNADTEFTVTGGLNLAGNLDVNGLINDIAGTLNLSGNALTASGLLTITPTAGLTVNTNGSLILNAAGQSVTLTGTSTIFNTSTFYLNNTGAISIGTHGSEQNITFETANFDVNSTGTVTIDGTNFTYTPTGTYTVAPGSTYTVDATGTISIDSDASATLSGAGVNLTSDGANAITLTYANTGTFQLTDGITRLEVADNGDVVLGDDGATTFVDGSLITLSGNTLITGTITETLTDNSADALDVQEGTNNYININTINNNEAIQFGNVTTNPSYSFLGTGTFSTGSGSISLSGATTITGANTFSVGTGTATFGGNILASTGSLNIGSSGTRFGTIYTDNLDATNISGVIVTGSTSSNDWTINSDNATADTENMSLAFERGTITPNATLVWDATSKKFIFNGPLELSSGIGTASFLAPGLITGQAGLTITGAAINLNASSNFATNINTGTSTSTVAIGGNLNTVAIDSSDWDITTTGVATNFDSYNGLVITANTGVITTGTWNGTSIADANVDNNITLNGGTISGTNNTMTLGSDATGDIYYRNSSGYLTRLPIGTSAQVLHGGTIPGYSAIVAADITADSLDFTEFKDLMTLDATTDVAMAGNNFTFSGTGNVGIGTTSPGEKLDVTTGNIRLTNYAAAAGTLGQFQWYQTYSSPGLAAAIEAYRSPSNVRKSSILFSTSDDTNLVERMRINYDGNVGIGTTIPRSGYLLDVNTAAHGISVSLPSNYSDGLTIFRTNTGADDQRSISFASLDGTKNPSVTISHHVSNTSNYQYLEFTSAYNSGIGYANWAFMMGNIGIGTTSPLSKLSLYNASSDVGLAFGDTNTTRFTIGTDYSDSSKLKISASSALGTNDRVTITTDGNVGIGTTGPVAKLHVVGGIYATSTIQSIGGGFINFASGNTTIGASTAAGAGGGIGYASSQLQIGSNSSYPMVFYSGASETMRITTTGNVGIGTTGPGYPLDVSGAVHSSVSSGSNLVLSKTSGASLAFDNGAGVQTAMIESGSPANANRLEFWTNTSGNTGLVERMRIDNEGNVGIGTTGPGAALEVNGNIRTTGTGGQLVFGTPSSGYYIDRNSFIAYDNFTLSNYSTNRGIYLKPAMSATYAGDAFFVQTKDASNNYINRIVVSAGVDTVNIQLLNGNVGIGTTSPAYKLSVSGVSTTWSTAPILALYDATVGVVADSRNWLIGNVATNYGDLVFANSTAQGGNPNENVRMVINKSGNVGIGTTDPTQKLTVAGNINVVGGSFIDDGTTLTVPDYVFELGYNLLPIPELEAYLMQNFHLPGVISREQVKTSGMNYGNMIMSILEKTEENTLYAIGNYKNT